MLYRKYMTPKNATKGQPYRGALKVRMITTEVERMPTTSQGLNLPHLLRVRSMMLPMIGSFSASKIRAATMIAVIASSC